MSALREIAEPFVVAPPAGIRVRTRLRVSGIDAAVLREVGGYLGSLASADLAARCAEGPLDVRQRARSRQVRKRELTAKSSSRWAGTLTRTSEDAYQLAYRNLLAERRSLLARIKRIEARLAVTAGTRAGRVHGYPTAAERHAKTIRIQALRTRLAEVERQLGTGRVSVCRGGKALLHKRNNLADAGLSETWWRERWAASRLFLTADGEKDKTWGNETIRWNPAQNWLEIRLPAPLARLANRPNGRYRLSCLVEFTYRGGDVAAQAATGAVRYDISFDPARGRWYLDASWKTPATEPITLAQARQGTVVAVDMNTGHLAVAVLDRDGNRVGVPYTIGLPLAGLPSSTRDGRLRAAITSILATARKHRASAVVIENLDFDDTRRLGRERTGNRPSRGRRGRAFRRQVAGIPTARFRDRLAHMACNADVAVIAVDPAYTSRWGAQHWLASLQQHHPKLTGHHAAAFVIGRRGLGLRARRRASRNLPAPEDAAAPERAKSTQARPETHPKTGTETRRPATRTDPRQPPGIKTGRPRRTTAGDQATQDRSGPPAGAGLAPARRLGTVGDMSFSGWPEEALDFYEGLEADNSKTYWTSQKAVYDQMVLGPMNELLEELGPEFGEGKVFRPYRDVRFSKDKSPYKTQMGARLGRGYIQFSARGLAVGDGMYGMESDQLDRYRRAVAHDTTGTELERVIAGIEQHGYGVHGRDALKSAPRGYSADHPRIGLLRYKGIVAWMEWPVEPWLETAAVKDRITSFLRATQPLGIWLDTHVGPTGG